MSPIDAPKLYRAYTWTAKHALFGYPPDEYPSFEWISSLERRFERVRQQRGDAPIYLIREMIEWGGSQNGVLQKFDDAIGTYCLTTQLTRILDAMDRGRREAIETALEIPGLGLSYASKLLRFLDPENYGALDSRIRGALDPTVHGVPKIYDGHPSSMVRGYCAFLGYLDTLKAELQRQNVVKPPDERGVPGWRAGHIEMALFQWAVKP